jgi:hypothetical protein
VGIVRVVGSPSILQLIYRTPGGPGMQPLEDDAIDPLVDTLDTARQKGVFKLASSQGPAVIADSRSTTDGQHGSSSDPDIEVSKMLAESPPNIVLNVSGGTVRRAELILAATAGMLLQIGVLVYDAILIYVDNSILDVEVPPHAYPLTCAGTIGICLGTFICAFIIESSTEEEDWEAASPEKQSFGIMWLQRGKVVGDQAFGSFAIYNTVHDQRIRTSRKSTITKPMEIWTLLGSILTVISFVLQFVG